MSYSDNGTEISGAEPADSEDQSIMTPVPTPVREKSALEVVKNVYSFLIVLFCIVILMGLMANRQSRLSSNQNIALAICIFWGAIWILSMLEGGQAALIGLAPVKRELYMNSHPFAFKSTMIVHKGNNLDRYLLGRQFMVVFLVFVLNLCGSTVEDPELWGLNSVVVDIFLTSGVAMILVTVMFGQLATQLNAARHMLDYINNFFCLFILWIIMLVEFSGLLHTGYLVQEFVTNVAGQTVESFEEIRSSKENFFYYLRGIISLVVLCTSLAVTLQALLQGQTTSYSGIPEWGTILLFVALLGIVGLLEGMQIAFLSVAKLPEDQRGNNRVANETCEVLFRGRGRNLPSFMIGRQICVVACFFIIARIVTVDVEVGTDDNIFNVSDPVQRFFNTGTLGAVITTIFGSIIPQLLASAFPIHFLSNPLSYVFLRLCLLLEATGIASGSWVLASIHKRVNCLRNDAVYIGTAEERAARNAIKDDSERLHSGPGHPVKLPGDRKSVV